MKNIPTPQELESLKSVFEPLTHKRKGFRPCMVKYMGEFIRVPSGKYLWTNKGAARSAIRNAIPFDKIFHSLERDERFGYTTNEAISECLTYLEKEGILEYIIL